MDERDPLLDEPILSAAEEAEVGRLLAEAGPRPPIPLEDLAAITNAARAAWQAKVERPAAPRWRRRLPAMTALAAALALLAVGLTWWWSTPPTPGPTIAATVESATGPLEVQSGDGGWREVSAGSSVPPEARVRAGAGSRAALRLAGGPLLRLDAGTQVAFSADALVLDRGAVYLDTGPTPHGERAVTVRTAVGTARDVGTRFTVSLTEAPDRAMRVRVRDGRVAVEQEGAALVAEAGEEVIVHPDGRFERRTVQAFGSGWEWVLQAAAGFEVEGKTLAQLLDWATRETGWTVRFADPRLAASARSIVLHGEIGNLPPDQAALAVLPGAGLEGELSGSVLTIRRLTSPSRK